MKRATRHGNHAHGGETEPDFHDDMHDFVAPLKPGDPGPKALERITPPDHAVFLPRQGSHVPVRTAANPNPNGSLGYIDRFVNVPASGGGHFHGTLVVSFAPELLGSVAIETLRAFQWRPETGSYRLIYRSGVGQSRDYVWALIEEPGLYAVIGVNADPLVARTLGIMHYLHGWLHAGDQQTQDLLHGEISRMLLSDSRMQKLLQNRTYARRLVEENLRQGLPGKWPGGIPPRTSARARKALQSICDSPDFPREPPEAALVALSVMSPADGGQWDLQGSSSEVLAVHAALLRTDKVLYFSGSEHDKPQHQQQKVDHTRLWDPASGSVATVGSPLHDLFCCGHAFLDDGRLVAGGGTQRYSPTYKGLRNTTIFDPGFTPGQNPWTAAAMMHKQRGRTKGGGRWYPAMTTLSDGRVLTVAGHPEKTDTRAKNIMVEIFDPSPSPLGSYADRGDQPKIPKVYPRMFLLPDGQVYCATHVNGKTMKLNPLTNAKVDLPGPGSEFSGIVTTAVLLPLLPQSNYAPRVLMLGGAQPKMIDLSAPTPAWQTTGPRTLPGSPVRKNLNATLLPDATVLVTGGSESKFDADAVLAAERYNPSTDAWSTLANAAVPRLYHSVALLLADGRVWTAGSNFDCKPGTANRELRIELYSPPYLFQGARPTIASAPASVSAAPATTFLVGSPQANDIAAACLIRCGSVTHGFDSDQRYVGLSIQSHTASTLTIGAPASKNVAPPGFYLLFIVNGDGIPSVAKFIRVT